MWPFYRINCRTIEQVSADSIGFYCLIALTVVNRISRKLIIQGEQHVKCVIDVTWFIRTWKETAQSTHTHTSHSRISFQLNRSFVHSSEQPFPFDPTLWFTLFSVLFLAVRPQIERKRSRIKTESMHSIRGSNKLRLHYNAQYSIPLNDSQTFGLMSCLHDYDIREVFPA